MFGYQKKGLVMKKFLLAVATLLAISVCCAAGFGDVPESSIPTPAEKDDVARNAPDIGAKENADWQKLREERREAREQILEKLRNSAEEKNSMRENALTPKNPRAAVSVENPVVPPHENAAKQPKENPLAGKKNHPVVHPFVPHPPVNHPMIEHPVIEHPVIVPPGHTMEKPEKINTMYPVHP